MPYLPKLDEQQTYQQVTDTFLGYNHALKIQEGEMYDEKNLTSDYFPMLASRKHRGSVAQLTNPGGCFDKGELVYVDGGRLYYNGQRIEGVELVDGEKQFISMGVKLIIWPDKIAVDVLTGKAEYFSPDVEAKVTSITENTITADIFPVLFADFSLAPSFGGSATEWQPLVATFGKDRNAIRFNEETKEWTLPTPIYKGAWSYSRSPYGVLEPGDIIIPWSVTTTAVPQANIAIGHFSQTNTILPEIRTNTTGHYAVYTRWDGEISIYNSHCTLKADIFRYGETNKKFSDMFRVGDLLEIDSGDGKLKSSMNPVTAIDDSTNKITFKNRFDNAGFVNYNPVRIWLPVPEMDYITEASNRIWGCKYGVVNGENINEIYACALGDYRNWQRYQGISTDSYTASVGTDGKWTGAATYQGNPIFFKENCFHKVYVSSTGAHQISDVSARGVQEGCANSIAVVGDKLFYKSRSGIMLYDNSVPQLVSENLGNIKYHDAAAGALDEKYYVSMCDDDGEWSLFVLDTTNGLWHKEDDTHASSFARVRNELYYIDAGRNELMCVAGSDGDPEGRFPWSATTGLIGYTTVEQKYVSRFNIRMMLPVGSEADMFIQYDSDGNWEHCGHMEGVGTGSFMVPVRPRRCDHFAVRIEGRGDVRIYSIAKILEKGSDVT